MASPFNFTCGGICRLRSVYDHSPHELRAVWRPPGGRRRLARATGL